LIENNKKQKQKLFFLNINLPENKKQIFKNLSLFFVLFLEYYFRKNFVARFATRLEILYTKKSKTFQTKNKV
jgi:hypothetical protein